MAVLLAVAALTPQHTYLILTKRSGDMRAFMNRASTRDAVWTRAEEIAAGLKKKSEIAIRRRTSRKRRHTDSASQCG